ncbi:uncharacterized protein N7518_004611 [Penicillium psychrosexuale]|uniref:uncharacterized protein n=1 Tax=Penicillium psychrosexuale TaxID=1002107 RepID=UPI0025452239|nr:uncharacterized protein N7518_004611 [Penicillium psychrosexuale]KAJ5796071.1 hypothetical protein N7518_004611 [Penicillium psychrosexuale]
MFDVEETHKALKDQDQHGDDWKSVGDRLEDKIFDMSEPTRHGHIPIHFVDPEVWLLEILAYNRLVHPQNFDLGLEVEDVHQFLA